MVQMGYLKEGTITKFSGIPFTRDYPFTYLEAKRLLGLIMAELKTKKSLQKLGVDPKLPGRGAIKAHKGWNVWDFMRLKASAEDKDFTKYPHLTVGIHADKAVALITLPHKVKRAIRNKIFGPGQEAFNELVFAIAKNIKNILSLDSSVQPYIKVLQRHYPKGQSGPGVNDAELKYDLRTVLQNSRSKFPKYQPQWLETTYEVMTNRKSNIQFEVGIEIPYRESKTIHTAKAIAVLEQGFLAMKPFLKQALN